MKKEPRYLNTDPTILKPLKRHFKLYVAIVSVLGVIVIASLVAAVIMFFQYSQLPNYGYGKYANYSNSNYPPSPTKTKNINYPPSPTKTKNINQADIRLAADVSYANGVLNITNQNKIEWVNVCLGLRTQDGNSDYEYSLEIPLVTSGESVKIDLKDFYKSDGTYFDPLTAKPAQVVCWVKAARWNTNIIYTWTTY
jgi:hypothetical protein